MRLFGTLFVPALVDALRLAGRPQDALATLDDALATPTEERSVAPELHRLRGELLIEAGNQEDGEQAREKAIALGRDAGNKVLELRSILSLARMCARSERAAEAHGELAELCSTFKAVRTLLISWQRDSCSAMDRPLA
jgi:hypothetical protein